MELEKSYKELQQTASKAEDNNNKDQDMLEFKLEEEIDKNKDLTREIKDLEKKLQEMDNMIKILLSKHDSANDQLKSKEDYIVSLKTQCEELDAKVKEKEKKIMNCENREESLITKLKDSFNMNQKMLIELNNLKEYIDWIKKKNNEINVENEHLKNTIGANYYDLTPRPNWGLLHDEFKEGVIDCRMMTNPSVAVDV